MCFELMDCKLPHPASQRRYRLELSSQPDNSVWNKMTGKKHLKSFQNYTYRDKRDCKYLVTVRERHTLRQWSTLLHGNRYNWKVPGSAMCLVVSYVKSLPPPWSHPSSHPLPYPIHNRELREASQKNKWH